MAVLPGKKLHKQREIRWMLAIIALVLLLFAAIKGSVYLLLNVAPDTYLKADTRAKRVLGSGTPDTVLTPVKQLNSGYLWQSLPAVAPAPVDNPQTLEKVRLGEMLFFDQNLSRNRTVSCSSCHGLYEFAGADGAPVSTGIYGQKGDRNAPTVWNTAFQTHLFWDGRARSLEEQAVQPFLNPVEMGLDSRDEIEQRVREQPHYAAAFAAAFAGDSKISIKRIAQAIASYERTLITNDAPYDEFLRGNQSAMTPQQLNGMALFEKTGCVFCHTGPNFSAASIFEPGLGLRVFPANPDKIPAALRQHDGFDQSAVWRVPSLRNVALTGPWFHNGAVDNLHDVVRIMSQAQLGKSGDRAFLWSEHALDVIENPNLSDQQIDDIVAFLHALSSKKLVAASKQLAQVDTGNGTGQHIQVKTEGVR